MKTIMGVRTRLLYALGACLSVTLLLVAINAMIPDRDQRIQRDLSRVLARGLSDDAQNTRSAESRAELIDLFILLRDQGDEWGMYSLAPIFIRSDFFTDTELDLVIAVALHDATTWNTALPQWKADLLNKRILRGHSPKWMSRLFERFEVAFVFPDQKDRYRELFLAGNWNGQGEIDDVRGWMYKPMRRENGRWVLRERLRGTLSPSAYHGVVRSAPWPRGEAVAHAAFFVPSQKEVVLLPETLSEPGNPSSAQAVSLSSSIAVAVALLDGASWQSILPLVHRGLLPNFARLLRGSSWGTLVSSGDGYPSEPNIYSALTGKPYYEHGMISYFAFSMSLRSAPLWKIVSDHSGPVNIVNIPNTFPPSALHGNMVSDVFVPVRTGQIVDIVQLGTSQSVLEFADQFGVGEREIKWLLKLVRHVTWAVDTAYPGVLAEQLFKDLPALKLSTQGMSAISEVFDINLFQVLQYLTPRHPSQLSCVYMQSVDFAHHTAWNQLDMDDISRSGEFLRTYQRADWLIGYLLDHARSVMVFSDHGGGSSGRGDDAASTPGRVQARFNISKLSTMLKTLLREDFKQGITSRVDGRRHTLRVSRQDLGAATLAQITELLNKTKYIPSGEPVFSHIHVALETDTCSISFDQEQPRSSSFVGIELRGRNYPGYEFFDIAPLQGIHYGNGIFAVAGPQIKPQPMSELSFVSDIAPTALFMLDLPQARDMKGRVMKSAFTSDYVDQHPPRYVSSYGDAGPRWWKLARAIRWRNLVLGIFDSRT